MGKLFVPGDTTQKPHYLPALMGNAEATVKPTKKHQNVQTIGNLFFFFFQLLFCLVDFSLVFCLNGQEIEMWLELKLIKLEDTNLT